MKALARRPERGAARRAEELGRRTEVLTFLLGGEAYALPIHVIGEILKPLPITEVPRAAEDVLGVMSVRGRLVTVRDLRRRFHLTVTPADKRARILLVHGDRESVGFFVDEVGEVVRLADSEIEPANVLGGEQAAHIAGIGRPPGGLFVLLDLKPILDG